MERKKVKWGILGAANIARKNWQAIQNSGNSIVTAIASRDLARGKQFLADCQKHAPMEVPATVYSNYQELLDSADVDAVYIPLPTGLRKEWVIRAAQAGKHVMCEKPCANTSTDLKEMIDVCQKHKVQFMDGVMFMHSARLPAMRREIDSNLGTLKRISSAFSFRGDEDFFSNNIRINAALEPFGCLGDLGWYCIRFALWVMEGSAPTSVTGKTLQHSAANGNEATVPTEFSGELFFQNGASSTFYCSFSTETEQWAHISGSNGLLRLNDFVLPYFGDEVSFEVTNPLFNVDSCDFNMEPHCRRVSVPEYSNSHKTSQETNLFRNFSDLVQSGKLDNYWPEIALKTQQVMEACLKSAHQKSAPQTV